MIVWLAELDEYDRYIEGVYASVDDAVACITANYGSHTAERIGPDEDGEYELIIRPGKHDPYGEDRFFIRPHKVQTAPQE